MNPIEFTKECREMFKTPDDDKGWTVLAGYVIWLEVKLEHACEIIDKRVPVCPNCGDDDLEIRVDKENFGSTDIFVPIHSCKQCSFQWTDDIGGNIWDKNRALLKEKDKQIESLEIDIGNLRGEILTIINRGI